MAVTTEQSEIDHIYSYGLYSQHRTWRTRVS
jgi:hypothetical protein